MKDIQIGNYDNTTYTFTAGTRKIYINNFPYNFNKSTVKLVTNQTQNYLIAAPSAWKATISGGTNNDAVIDYSAYTTLPVLSATDEILITVNIPDVTEDISLGVNKVINQSPEWSHYLDQNEPIDYTNQTSGTTRDVLYISSYSNLKLAFTSTCGTSSTITVTLHAPQKSTCVDTDNVNWYDVTNELIGVSSLVINNSTPLAKVYYLINKLCEDRIMIKSLFAGPASNTLTVSYKMS
jgi:hypothetical protein